MKIWPSMIESRIMPGMIVDVVVAHTGETGPMIWGPEGIRRLAERQGYRIEETEDGHIYAVGRFRVKENWDLEQVPFRDPPPEVID